MRFHAIADHGLERRHDFFLYVQRCDVLGIITLGVAHSMFSDLAGVAGYSYVVS